MIWMTGPLPVGGACWRRRSRRSRWSLVSPSSYATDARSVSISLFLAARLASRSATGFLELGDASGLRARLTPRIGELRTQRGDLAAIGDRPASRSWEV